MFVWFGILYVCLYVPWGSIDVRAVAALDCSKFLPQHRCQAVVLRAVVIERRRGRPPRSLRSVQPSVFSLPFTVIHAIFNCSGMALPSHSYYDPHIFRGGVIDSGAAATCIGEEQARAYCRENGKCYEEDLKNVCANLSFGNSIAKTKGSILVSIKLPEKKVKLDVPVVEQRVPLLLWANFLENNEFILRNTKRVPVSEAGWSVPVSKKRGH